MGECKHDRYVEDVHDYCPDCGEDRPSISHRYEARIKGLKEEGSKDYEAMRVFQRKYIEADHQLRALKDENQRLREITPVLKRALLDISLCSQNSMSSKRECGRIARDVLDTTSELHWEVKNE